jgi:group I intron endonuclease
MIGIYKITSPTKKIYIGQSIDIEKRFKNYEKLRCKGQTILYRSLKKYGFEKHKFEIICECSIEELNELERYYQDAFSAISKNGLNCSLTKSSDRSGEMSKESRKKMSDSQKGKKQSEETILKRIISNKGKKRTEEMRNRISIANKGKKRTEEMRNRISEENNHKTKIILNTETGIFYYGSRLAANSININAGTLRRYLIGIKNNIPFVATSLEEPTLVLFIISAIDKAPFAIKATF